MATVQAPGGDVIVSRSGDDGVSWADRLVKAPKGSNFSAADVVLLPEGKAMITYVNERVRRAKLLATKVVSRWSPDDGTSLRKPRTVAGEAKRLRMAPNIASIGRQGHHRAAVGPHVGCDAQPVRDAPALACRQPSRMPCRQPRRQSDRRSARATWASASACCEPGPQNAITDVAGRARGAHDAHLGRRAAGRRAAARCAPGVTVIVPPTAIRSGGVLRRAVTGSTATAS